MWARISNFIVPPPESHGTISIHDLRADIQQHPNSFVGFLLWYEYGKVVKVLPVLTMGTESYVLQNDGHPVRLLDSYKNAKFRRIIPEVLLNNEGLSKHLTRHPTMSAAVILVAHNLVDANVHDFHLSDFSPNTEDLGLKTHSLGPLWNIKD